jgi:hypothetical protein
MVEPVPKYLFRIYCTLWLTFGEREFSNSEAMEVIGRGERYSNQAIHYLKKSGWLVSKGLKSDDKRKHANQLLDPMIIIRKIGEAGGESIVSRPAKGRRFKN